LGNSQKLECWSKEVHNRYTRLVKSQEWLIINVTGAFLSRFYIFKGEGIKDNYIGDCKPKACMVVEKMAWMTCFLFKEYFSFFIKFILVGISQSNHHLLILDGHGSHVTLEVIEHAS
jgi:hypothetical protein